MENSEKNRIQKEIKERLGQADQAVQQGDYSQAQRIVRELYADPIYLDVQIKMLVEQLEHEINDTRERMLRGEQEPNIARCVLAIMEELRGINLWDGSENSSYKRALEALEAYQRLEKKRVEFLATKAAYEKAAQEYRDTKEILGHNLNRKWLEPLGGGNRDPMKWYFTAQEIVKLQIQLKTPEDEEPKEVSLSVATLRKYQSLGLIPKPIRMGRQSRYSALTLIRIALIQAEKESGIKLKDIEPARIEKWLKDTLDSYNSLPQNRPPTPVEMTYCHMTQLIDKKPEELSKSFERAIDRSLDELRAKKQGG